MGRGADCECELNDDFASRYHTVIEWRGDHHHLMDLGSTNGTYVNEARVMEHRLEQGDQIRIGSHVFKYLPVGDVEAKYHEEMSQMMRTDPLTQAYNRRYFEDAFQREVLRSSRHGRGLGVVMFDVDHFKGHNDTQGHIVGDELLAGLCRRIKARVRGDEILARIGGEEFAVVAVEISREQLVKLAEDIRAIVASRPFETSNGPVPMTISVGVAHTTGLEMYSPKELMDMADKKLYEAKGSGRNRVCF